MATANKATASDQADPEFTEKNKGNKMKLRDDLRVLIEDYVRRGGAEGVTRREIIDLLSDRDRDDVLCRLYELSAQMGKWCGRVPLAELGDTRAIGNRRPDLVVRHLDHLTEEQRAGLGGRRIPLDPYSLVPEGFALLDGKFTIADHTTPIVRGDVVQALAFPTTGGARVLVFAPSRARRTIFPIVYIGKLSGAIDFVTDEGDFIEEVLAVCGVLDPEAAAIMIRDHFA